jgi:hypothetical protein
MMKESKLGFLKIRKAELKLKEIKEVAESHSDELRWGVSETLRNNPKRD